MTDTSVTPPAGPAGPAGPAATRGSLAATIARTVFYLHAALLAAQPFLAGALLDAMSPAPQVMHRMVAMTIVSVALIQIFAALAAVKGRSRWARGAYTGSIALCLIELVQFSLGHLSIGLAVHIPLGIFSLGFGVYLVWRYARPTNPHRAPQPR